MNEIWNLKDEIGSMVIGVRGFIVLVGYLGI